MLDRPGRQGAQVEFRQVTKSYTAGSGEDPSDVGAGVHNLSLTVEPGEICVLVGPSGCGKTTTLRMVNRLVEPTSGQILVDDVDIAAMDTVKLRRSIGYVIQQIGLFPHRTIAENVATVPHLLDWPDGRIRERVDELLTLVGLDPATVRNVYPAQLSGGERQRVGVARAMAAEPGSMLMDEPFGAVDPIVRARLQDEFLRIQRQLGTTVIFVTHDIDEAIKMGSRVAVMQRGGILLQYSPPAELLLHPVNDYVAEFVGADRVLKSLALIRVGDLTPHSEIPAALSFPRLQETMNARDALAQLLSVPEHAGAVVASDGRIVGTVTVEDIEATLVQSNTPSPAPLGDIARST